jgi:hypothetical protein
VIAGLDLDLVANGEGGATRGPRGLRDDGRTADGPVALSRLALRVSLRLRMYTPPARRYVEEALDELLAASLHHRVRAFSVTTHFCQRSPLIWSSTRSPTLYAARHSSSARRPVAASVETRRHSRAVLHAVLDVFMLRR